MSQFLWAAVFGLGLALGGCAADDADRSSGGATATTEKETQDMRGSSDTAPGAQGDRRRPSDAPPATKY